ncbi:MAG: M48 family metallopeptidase, partial [Planctomycetota bacterium]
MEIKVIRSAKRRRTISGRMVGETMFVNAPQHTPETELTKIIAKFQKRFERRKLRKELNLNDNLMDIFRRLNEQYFDNGIDVQAIEYSTNQTSRWGVCNSRTKTILISHRLAEFPDWVRDYVIVHEMAHILQPNHSRRFWKLVRCYKRSER